MPVVLILHIKTNCASVTCLFLVSAVNSHVGIVVVYGLFLKLTKSLQENT